MLNYIVDPQKEGINLDHPATKKVPILPARNGSPGRPDSCLMEIDIPHDSFFRVIDLDFQPAEFHASFDVETRGAEQWFEQLHSDFNPIPFTPTTRVQRFRMSEAQRAVILTWIKRTGKVYLTKIEAKTLAAQTSLSLRQIRIFFTNFRMRKGCGRNELKKKEKDSQLSRS